MMNHLILSLLLIAPFAMMAQTSVKPKEIRAEYPGGYDSLNAFFFENVKLPRRELSGSTMIKFTVGVDGQVGDIEVISEFNKCRKCDKEVVRVAAMMAEWKPAKNGEVFMPQETFYLFSFNDTPPPLEEDVKVSIMDHYEDYLLVDVPELADTTQDVNYVAEVAEFPGGLTALRTFLSKNIHYPDSAFAKGIEGRVYLRFVVETNGQITHIEIMRGIAECPECDIEAVRVFTMMPRWNPGRKDGKIVRSYYNQPIKFSKT